MNLREQTDQNDISPKRMNKNMMPFQLNPERLQLKIIKCPYDTWANPEVQSTFGKLINFKLNSFGARFDNGVMPMDTFDFISTHLLAIHPDERGEPQIVATIRSTPLNRCNRFRLAFPALELARVANAPQHAEALRGLVDKSSSLGEDIGYEGLWTIHPDFSRNASAVRILRGFGVAAWLRLGSLLELRTRIAGATLKFGLSKFFVANGFTPLTNLDGSVLPDINVPHLHNAAVRLMVQHAAPEHAPMILQPWKKHWEQKEII